MCARECPDCGHVIRGRRCSYRTCQSRRLSDAFRFADRQEGVIAVARRATNAGRRTEIEQWLDEHGVDWEYWTQLPLTDFDRDASLHNQARFQQLDKERVETYAESVKRGDKFPAVVAWRPTGRGKLVMVDGNHRYEGHLLANKSIDAYIIKGNKQNIVMMTYEANAKHGLPTTHDERISQALWLVGNGMSQEDAAAAMQVKRGDLQ